MKRGFTLIELLAVIVLLSIIAVIAVPIVIDVINDSKQATKLRSIENIEKAVELYVVTESKIKDTKIKDVITVNELLDLGYIKNAEKSILNKKIFIKQVNDEFDFFYEGRDTAGNYTSLKQLIEKNNNINKNVIINGKKVNKIYGTKDEQLTMKNYVLYSGQLFEVIETNDINNTIKLVSATTLSSIAYGTTNDFNSSWVKKWLNEVFLSSLERIDIIKDTEFCIDNIDVIPSEYTKMESCTNKITEKVGLLTYEDYIYAKDGETIQDGGSFLDQGEVSYLITPTTLATNQIWHTHSSDPSQLVTTNTYTNTYGQGVRPVISIRDDVLVKSGSGTKSDPYILSVERVLDKKQKLNLGKVGDYVYIDESNNPYVKEIDETYIANITNKTTTDKTRYRIVNINEDGSVKLERADIIRTATSSTNPYIPFYSIDSGEGATSCLQDTTQKYGTDTIKNGYYLGGCTNHNIFNPNTGEGAYIKNTGDSLAFYLNNASNSFYNFFSDKAKKIIIKYPFVLNVSGYGKDYSNLPNDGITNAYVGLPSWGEMYTGNDLNVSYWYLNSFLTDKASYVTSKGNGTFQNIPYTGYRVRPIIVLSKNVFVKSGNGTANNPYVLDI